MTDRHDPVHITLVATPDAQISPLSGLFETFNAFRLLGTFEHDLPAQPFEVEIVADVQRWIGQHYMVADPVDEMVRRSGLARRTLERRFGQATGHSPLSYVQNLRVSEARWRLERTDLSVEEIGLEVGYENVAFFRRVFRRVTRLTPGAYRRKFQLALRD